MTFKKFECVISVEMSSVNIKSFSLFFWIFFCSSLSFSTKVNLDSSSALRWFLSNRWIIVIFDKNVKRNIIHSLNFWDFLSMIRIWSVDFNAKWSMMIMKNSSSKSCDNFVKVQMNVVVFNFVAQYLDSTSIKLLKRKRIKRFTSFFSI
jgi:hypothetical protein